MAYLAWLQRDRLSRRAWLSLRNIVLPGRAGDKRWVALALGSIMPLLLTWYDPRLLPSAVMLLTLMVAASWWSLWPGLHVWRSFLAWGVSFGVFLVSWLALWMFLENPWYRVVFMIVVGVTTWWYLNEWSRAKLTLQGEYLGASTAALMLGFLSAFALGSTAESLLVYLALPIPMIFMYCYQPLILAFGACAHVSGWRLVHLWQYWLVGALALFQVMLVALWWPTSFYVVGYTLAAAFTVVILVLRHDAQGFFNRVSLWRELSTLGAISFIVFLGARWF